MKTSVVMATYNGEDFIMQQLDSISAQSELPDEIIIVDDGSSDRTREILTRYVEKQEGLLIQLVFRESNVGYIQNFIDGIARASNELIFLCDQDDIWHIDKIKDTKELFKENSDMIVLHTNTDIIDQNGNTLRKNVQDYHKKLEKIKLSKYVNKVNYPGMAMAFRKSVVYPELEWLLDKVVALPTHDWVIGFIAAKSNGFYTTNAVYSYRRYTGQNVALSLQKKSSILDRVNGIEIYEELFQFIKEYQLVCQKKYLLVENYLETARTRKKYLTNQSIFLWSKSFPLIRYYPKYGSYIRDILEIIKERRINDKKN